MSSAFSAIYLNHGLAGDEVYTVFNGSPADFVKFNVPPFNASPGCPISGSIPYSRPLNDVLPWIHPTTPYMAMIPWNDPFHGPLFGRLRFPGGYVPVVRENRRWMLDPSIADDWHSLEISCRRAVLGMMNISHTSFIPRVFQLHAMPERFRYRDFFRTRQDAVLATMEARSAFLPLMGALSMMSLIFRYLDMHGDLTFDWRERLAAEAGVHPAWVSRLEDSVLFDLKEPRVGGIIRVKDWQGVDNSLFPLFQLVNMPIFLNWGQVDVRYGASGSYYLSQQNCIPPSWIMQYLLHRKEARQDFARLAAETLRRRSPQAAETPRRQPPQVAETSGHQPAPARFPTPESASAALPHPEPPSLFPPVERYSGQRHGETIVEFFKRRAELNDRTFQRETARERQSREAKERNAQGQACPGRAGARVYIWEEVNGHRIRRAAGRPNYDHFWEMYRPTQRRYDGFRDEWDLCSEFDPSAQHPDSDEDSDRDSDEDEPLPAYSPPPPPCEVHAVGDLMSDLANIHDDNPPLEPNPDVPVEDLGEVAYNRFGFQEESPLPPDTADRPWEIVRKVLGEGYGASKQGVLLQDMQQSLSTFFGHLATSKTVADIPPALYDINQPASDINCLPHNTRVSIIGENPVYYVFVPCDSVHDSQFFVVIRSPATVVEIIRRMWDRDTMSMVQELLKRCIPFQLCIPGPYRGNLMPTSIPSVSSLGRRTRNSKFDEVDFLLYERLRDEFFRSPRGHLALLAGGIIARLAREVIPFSKVYDGLADSIEKDGMFICKGDGRPGYYSHVLSETEVDLILGVYHVDTGELTSTHKFSNPSLMILQCKEVAPSRPSSSLGGRRGSMCLHSGLGIGHPPAKIGSTHTFRITKCQVRKPCGQQTGGRIR
jgi:hypothetical protein